MASNNQSNESAPGPSTSLRTRMLDNDPIPLPVLRALKAVETLESGGDETEVFFDTRQERVRGPNQILTYDQRDPLWDPTEWKVSEEEIRKAESACIQDVYDLGIGRAPLALKKEQRIQDVFKVLGRLEKDKKKPLSKRDITALRAFVNAEQWNTAQIPRNKRFSKKLTQRLDELGITKREEED